jgi:hypothetical protein
MPWTVPEIAADTQAFVALHRFLGTEFSKENSGFINAVRSYKAGGGNTALDVCNIYVRSGSAKEINVTGAMRNTIVTAVDGGNADANTFDAALGAICALVGQDSLTRFLGTPEGAPYVGAHP